MKENGGDIVSSTINEGEAHFSAGSRNSDVHDKLAREDAMSNIKAINASNEQGTTVEVSLHESTSFLYYIPKLGWL